MSSILKGLNEGRNYGRDSWDSNMPGYQGDYGGAENFGRRNREWDEDDRIDARIRAEYEQKKQYEQNGKFWLKLKDSQRHLPAGPFTGKQAANTAAIELLKQQPELKGNLLITAYGPDETQTVAESSDELYGLRVGDTVKAVVNGKRVQGDVIDIFPETQQVELLLRGAYAGKTVTVDVQDTESIMEASTLNRAVDSKGRTQAQWMDLVMKKFPDARLIQAKMIDGPVHAMLPDGRKLSWNKVQQQGVSEGWQEEAEEIGKWAEYVRTKLLQTPKQQRWPMAGQLSQIEVKNFGSKLIPIKNYDNKTGKPVAGQSYFTEIVQRTLRALAKPEGMTQAGYQSLTLTPQDIDKPDDRGGKDWVVDAPLGWLVVPNAGQAPGRVKRLLWKAYNAGPEIYPLALEVWEETGDFTEQDYKDIIIKAAKLRDSGGLEGQAYQQYNQQQGIAEGQLDELSPKTLASYKKKAGADASAADKAGDYKRGNKRMSGIVRATKKEFNNDAKGVAEGRYDSDDYYNPRMSRDYGARNLHTDSGAYEFEKNVPAGEPGGERGRPQKLKGVSKSLPADAFGRTTGKIPAGKTGRIHSMMGDIDEELDENLNKWFKEKWVRFGPDGKIRGDCARGDDSEGKPKCLPQSKAQNLGKEGRASAASRKRREDPNPERSGKAINVTTKKKSNEGVAEEQLDELKCWSGYTRVQGVPAGAPGSCKKKTNEEDVAEGVAETLPIDDAVKVLRQYGADHFKTTSNELHFYKQGRPFSVDLVMNPDATRSVTLSSLNSATRGLKGQGVAEGSEYKSRHAHKQEQDKAYNDYRTKHATSSMALMTRAEFAKDQRERAAKKKQGVAEGKKNDKNDDHEPFNYDEWKASTVKPRKPRGYKDAEALGKAIDSEQSELRKRQQGVAEEQEEKCPHCGGAMFSEMIMNEKKDACYYKVKSRYKVWPSAYASGALVKCRKSGADSWGDGGKKSESAIMRGLVDENRQGDK